MKSMPKLKIPESELPMQYYAVIDTNVLVSAMLKRDSVPNNIIRLAFSGFLTPVFNSEILEEYRTVLKRPKFHLTDEIVDDIMAAMILNGVYIDPLKTDIVLTDPKDQVFYEVALAKRCEHESYLITGNIKHFPNEPFILTPRQMLDTILREG